jgi:sugar/nucleoside kinase (ribokinase family)
VKLPLSLTPAVRSLDVVTMGENSVDLVAELDRYPAPDSKHQLRRFTQIPGGEAASAAVGLARLGNRVAYVGRFGDDGFGDTGRERLADEGVDTSHVVVVNGCASRIAVILVERKTAQRTVLWQRDPRLSLEPADVPDGVLRQTRVLLVGSDDVPAMTDAAIRARAAGVRTVGDLERIHDGTRDLLKALDIIVMASSFPKALTGHTSLAKALNEIADFSRAAMVCVTLAEEGCLAVVADAEIHVPAFTIDAIDTTGAGDLFRAGLIARWLIEPGTPEVRDLLRYANAVAALNCRGVGAWTAAPRRSDVESLLKS